VKRVVILISGRGSNMEALLKAKLPCEIAAVISNRAEAQGLEIALAHGIATATVPHKDYPDRASFDTALTTEIDSHQPDLIVLAGFMRILTDDFVNRYAGQLINIHPSLLPAYPGINIYRRALEDGVKIHGCTVHFVTPTLDNGPIIVQAAVPVLPNDTEQTLAARVLREEHRVLPQVLRWFCAGQIELSAQGRVLVNNHQQKISALISPSL